MKTPTKLLVLLSCLALSACDSGKKASQDPDPGTTPDADAPAPELQKFLLPETPAGAISVTEARKNPTAGTEIVVQGEIIGRGDVFVPNRSMLILGDPKVLTTCNRMPEDHCATPWDACCDDPVLITKSIATVQLLDADGKPFKTGLKGLGNMKELSAIVVKGTVAEGSSTDNLLITATGIHVAAVEPNNTPK